MWLSYSGHAIAGQSWSIERMFKMDAVNILFNYKFRNYLQCLTTGFPALLFAVLTDTCCQNDVIWVVAQLLEIQQGLW